jgi:hypothetical protein
MSEFSIDYDDGRQTTFNDLLTLQEEGYSVARSPHMALNTPNLGVAALGIPIIAYGEAYLGTMRDDRQQARYQVTKLGGITLADTPSERTMIRFIEAQDASGREGTLNRVHAELTQAAIDGSRVETLEGYLAQHKDLYRMVVDIALAQEMAFVDAVDTANGRWQAWTTDIHQSDQVLDVGTDDGVMAVAPLECKLAAMFAGEALDSNQDHVYHLGGRDMEGYVPGMTDTISALVGGLQEADVVGDLTVTILTTAGTKVVAHKSDLDLLNNFWDIASRRDVDSQREKKRLLQRSEVKNALGRAVSITDSEAIDGEGIAVVEQALHVPIKSMRHTLRKFQ